MKWLIFTLVLFLAPVMSAWADFDDGLAAARRGDFATALREWRPLAAQGDADAQYNLGVMYDKGRGVSQDYAEAVKWYRKAAEQGVAHAQFSLAGMYVGGHGVPQDYVQAHMWFDLAAALGDKSGAAARDYAADQMTAADVSKAQRLAREWLEKHGGKRGQ